MYFVVHFLKSGRNVVVPKTWIENIDEHWEKFINNSINRNQTFVCYYTENYEAYDEEGKPNGAFEPDFSLRVDPRFPNEGAYRVKLICYKSRKKNSLINSP